MTTTVLISYSHDSGPHEQRVLALADQLVADGVDVRLDQYEQGDPPEGWAQWAEHQIAQCQFVVMVFTPTFHSRYELAQTQQTAAPDERATWETMLVRHLLYTSGGRNTKAIPVWFDGAVEQLVPLSLRAWTAYKLTERYEDLLRRLLDQPKVRRPPLGPRRTLPPAPRPSFEDLTRANANGTASVSTSPVISQPSTTSLADPPRAGPAVSVAEPSRLTLPTVAGRPLTLIVFTANGAPSRDRLRLGKEVRAIRTALRDRLALKVCTMASFLDVVRELDEHEPALVHFSGHTDPYSNHLVLESEHAGDEVFVSPQQLSELFAELDRPPTLVTFTTCSSLMLAEAAVRHAHYAIGFDGPYPDDWAPLFSATLYDRLTSQPRLDVPRALQMTKLAWQSEGQDVAGQSRLYRGPGSAQDDEPITPTTVGSTSP
ncbi:MAG: TIR domain-containing protein [Deltaproteobacteria bacterium]|nr:TIR domain-containing protein [Deltaproteobacteria bacterium]